MIAKPFLKWAGGKTKLIPHIKKNLPENIDTYIEPFVGGGAILFWVLNEHKEIKNVVINDLNETLMKSYEVIKKYPTELIVQLSDIQKKYNNPKFHQFTIYSQIRDEFNKKRQDDITQTSFLIFLNKTCFNGLFRINKNNEFNVPFGKYKNPKICDDQNIIEVSKLLQKVNIVNGDFTQTINYISGNSLFYFDPPYKPISKTSSFNSFTKTNFDDSDQIRLKLFCDELNKKNVKFILSNSDLKNFNEDDDFFDKLYEKYDIKRVSMTRPINSVSSKRGEINELLIKNF